MLHFVTEDYSQNQKPVGVIQSYLSRRTLTLSSTLIVQLNLLRKLTSLGLKTLSAIREQLNFNG
jgi:hypothetical protein